MATSGSKPQRAWRANCPGCGAPVEFRSAASTHAVCGYCSTSVVRDGDSLKSLGKLSALFNDYSPLQIGASGVFQGKAFTVVGRLQYSWAQGLWNEWYCWYDNTAESTAQGGAGAWLSEDNGQFVWMAPFAGGPFPPLSGLALNQTVNLAGRSFEVSAITEATLSSGEGELPKMMPMLRPFTVVELRNAGGQILSLDYTEPDRPDASLGAAVKLEALQLKGLREQSEASIKGGRQFACPNCGASVSLSLESTKSLTCPSCNSLIDTSKGIGQEVVSALQSEPIRPSLSLGTSGKLKGTDWQLVGYVSMLGKDPGAPDESFGWEEYLMFNQVQGFAFLADTQEGWSVSRTLSGSAKVGSNGETANYLGTSYRLKERYTAEVNYVMGEFYWQVSRGAQTKVAEYSNAKATLVREQTPAETTWSRSEPVASAEVAQAFGLAPEKLLRQDITPVSGSKVPFATLLILGVFFLMLVLILSTCSNNDCDPSYQNCASSSGSGGWARGIGGSYGGGSSSGGGHK